MWGLMKRVWKRLRCKHQFMHWRNIYGDEILECGGRRSVWRCDHCKLYLYRDKLVLDGVMISSNDYVGLTVPEAERRRPMGVKIVQMRRSNNPRVPSLKPLPVPYIVYVEVGRHGFITYAQMPWK